MNAEIKNGFHMVPLTHVTSVWFCLLYLSWALFCPPTPSNPHVEVLITVFQNVTIFADRDFQEVIRAK